MGEGDALADVALEALDGLLQEALLLLGDALKRVLDLLGAVGLVHVSHAIFCGRVGMVLTPSSTGTEKKSTPTFLAIASPPGTPGR